MIEIKIDGKKHLIKRLSDLTFREFNDIIIKGEAYDLTKYLAYFCDLPIEKMLTSSIKCKSITSLYAQLFNVEIDKVITDEKKTVEFRNEVRAMSDISVDTYGKSYIYEMASITNTEGLINRYELSMKGLAIGLSKKGDASDFDEIYDELIHCNWMRVLPQAFFLTKHIGNSRIKRRLSSMSYILELKMIRLRMAFYLKRLKKWEKKFSMNNYVNASTVI